MSTSRVVLVLLCALYVPSVWGAQDLLDTLSAAEQNDPRYHSARYEFEAAREALPQARADLLPNITFDGARTETEQDILERDNIFFGAVGETKFSTMSWSFQASQPIFQWSSWVQVGQAKAQVRYARANYEGEKQQLIRRAAEAYLGVLASLDNQRLLQAELEAVGRQLKLVEGRRRGGLATVTEEYEARARFSRVEADLVAADYAVDDAYQAIREVAGDAVYEVTPFKTEFPLLPPDPNNLGRWINDALKQNFSLRAAEEAINIAKQEVRRQRAAHYPTVNFVARTGNLDTGGAVTGGGSDVDTTEYALQLRVPIYSGGRVTSQTRQANAQFNAALEDRKLQTRIVLRETRSAYQTVLSAMGQISALKDALTAQENSLDGREKGYRAGINTFLDVLDVERDLYETRRDFARARYQYLLNWLILKQQVGSLSRMDLEYVNSFIDRNAKLPVETIGN